MVFLRKKRVWEQWRKDYPRFLTTTTEVPKDVPKGHLVVYVGEMEKRFVIEVTLLRHPLIQALLEEASKEYGFTPNSRLHIPCEEPTFLGILRYIATAQHHAKLCSFCF